MSESFTVMKEDPSTKWASVALLGIASMLFAGLFLSEIKGYFNVLELEDLWHTDPERIAMAKTPLSDLLPYVYGDDRLVEMKNVALAKAFGSATIAGASATGAWKFLKT